MSFTQSMLNATNRNAAYTDIMVYVPDNSITISGVTASDILSYSDISSIIDMDRYTNQTIATLEENLWLLDGSFINPYSGQTYDGYISGVMSDDNGNFSSPPMIYITLAAARTVKYFTMTLNPAVTSAYPVTTVFGFYNGSTLLTSVSVNTADIDTLPTITVNPNIANCNRVVVSFYGTQSPHRRIRVSNVMFGRMIYFDTYSILSCDYDDKNSYVPDSIPSRTFTWDVENYDKRYNVDNPSTELPILNEFSDVSFRWGYETDDGDIEYNDRIHLKLLSVSTNDDDTATFEAGSILDMMTTIYDVDNFHRDRNIGEVVTACLNFCGLSENLVEYDMALDTVVIDAPLPQVAAREIIQLCAYGCGATLLITDKGGIKFANVSLKSYTSKGKWAYTDFVSIPEAEQLEYTSDIAVACTSSVIDTSVEPSNVAQETVTTYSVTIDYSATYQPSATCSGGTITDAAYYVDHCDLVVNFTGSNCTVTVTGYPITTKTTYSKTATNNTLIIDSQLLLDPTVINYADGDNIKDRYVRWYSKRFKYTMETRGEPLIAAGDIISIQTPFTSTVTASGASTPTPVDYLDVYVLENEIHFDGGWSGSMEVVAL